MRATPVRDRIVAAMSADKWLSMTEAGLIVRAHYEAIERMVAAGQLRRIRSRRKVSDGTRRSVLLYRLGEPQNDREWKQQDAAQAWIAQRDRQRADLRAGISAEVAARRHAKRTAHAKLDSMIWATVGRAAPEERT